jgi:long-chain acyl-CoA synthetase
MFIRGYGMAEANSYVAQTPPFEAGDNCLGWVLPPVKYRIVDDGLNDVTRDRPGELLLKGPNLTAGYWDDPAATERSFVGDGWFRTYDIVRKGKWGMLYFVGRSNEIIKSGGYKISAAEIDEILERHPEVEHAATVGIPDETKGERPMSAVMLRHGATASPDDVLEWARERIAPYKCPRRVFSMPDLPFTFSIKPKRFEVRERITKLLAEEHAAKA